MPKTPTAQLIGGPLDGQTRTMRRGRAPIYLDDAGTPMRPDAGDRVFARADGSAYIRSTRDGETVYVHSTART